jgi:PAS domain S-box-containing protein
MPLVGKRCYEAYHGRKERCEICPTYQTITTGKSAYEVVPKRGPNGDLVGWLDLYSFPFIDSSTGKMTGVIEYVHDITERKRTEETLRKSEERFKELYDNAPLGYHEYDAEGRITRVNRTELEMLGYTAEEMLGRYVWDFIVEGVSHEVVKAKLGGKLPPDRAIERTYRRKDGIIFPVLIQDRLIKDDEGRITGIRTTIQDITERKRAEKEMADLQEQLRQSQRIEAIGRLTGGIAHDFNNLLTVIEGYSQLSLLQLKEGDPLKGNIEEIENASQRGADLTQQLLAFSRRQILEFKVLDLNTILRDLDKMLHRIIGEDIELVYLLSDDLGKVKTDPRQIEQVILNLVVNARDAMPFGGKLTIETSNVVLDEAYSHTHIALKPGHYVMLSVSDTGIGMSPEVKERIFDPFFTTKEVGKGTGLGLSTVHGIVSQSGGHIWVYSEYGKGATFKIYLPRVEEETLPLRVRDETAALPGGTETILLVEDEPSVRSLASRILRDYGYTVMEAANGDEALQIAKGHSEKIHLLLADVVMPKIGGKDLADHLKSLRQDTKVLFTSGYTDNTIVHHGVLDPGVLFLQKPFSPEALLRKVREVLDE